MPGQVFFEFYEWFGAEHRGEAINIQHAPGRCVTSSQPGLFLRWHVVLRRRENQFVIAHDQLQVVGLRRSMRETQ
nr:hypothetical protein Hi04_10k_c4921_00008 [uncultured bacterium]